MAREVVHTLPYRWSKIVWIITFSFFIVAVAIIGLMIATIVQGGVVGGIIGLIIALSIFIAIAVYCEGYSPQRLEVSESQITILRRYNSVTILRSIIIAIEPLSAKDMRWTANLGGCGGLFGYFGRFSNRRLGEFTMYATAMDNLYLITTADSKKWVINCSEPDLLQKK